jgi:hypothetical protein
MGQATRNIANSFTTSGVITSSAVNNTSLGNITDLTLGGSLILLSEQTASADSSISFTSGIDSTYDEYWFIFNNIHLQTDNANFIFNGSTDSGSTYSVVKTTTYFDSIHREDDAGGSIQYQTNFDFAQATNDQPLHRNMDADNDSCCSGILKIFNPSSTTYVKHFFYRGNHTFNSTPQHSMDTFVAGYFNTTSAVNGFRFKANGGNIDDGTIQLFGVK